MPCADVFEAFAGFDSCVDTEHGTRVSTHCLYPSFDPVNVYVVRFGDGFRVHDGGGAERASWLHGRDDKLTTRMLNRYAQRYDLTQSNGVLTGDAATIDWLYSVILAVANASAAAANATVEHVVAAAESSLRERVFQALSRTAGEKSVREEFPFMGQSGKEHRFDFGIVRADRAPILIDTVTPHHTSIAHKYVAFADVSSAGISGLEKLAVYDKALESDDASLMRQVADLVPFASLDRGLIRMLRHLEISSVGRP